MAIMWNIVIIYNILKKLIIENIINTIITQRLRFWRKVLNSELFSKNLGKININTPIKNIREIIS